MKTPVPKTKPRKNRRAVTLEILRTKYEVFAEAAEELTRRTGQPANAELVMASMLEGQCDANDLADVYCWRKLKWTHDQIDQFSDHTLGRPKVRRRNRATAV